MPPGEESRHAADHPEQRGEQHVGPADRAQAGPQPVAHPPELIAEKRAQRNISERPQDPRTDDYVRGRFG